MSDPSNSNFLERPEAKPCETYAERIYLLAADELERPEAAEAEAHATLCADCSAFHNRGKA